MEEKYKKFKEFNWKDSNEWHMYYNNLFPTPPGNKIEKYKKKFYKLKIDPDFDINYLPPEESTSSSSSSSSYSSNSTSYQQHQYSQSQYQSSNSLPAINSLTLTNIETLVMFLFAFSLPIKFHTLKISALALIIRSIRFCGKPQWSTEFAQKIISNDTFHVLLYSLLLFIDRFNYYLILPIAMAFLEYICTNLKQLNISAMAPFMKYIDMIINKKEQFIQCRAHVEVANGFLLIIGVFFKTNAFLLPILYWQFMKVKYVVNPHFQKSFAILNQYVNAFKNHHNTPSIVKMIIDKIQWVFEYMGKVDLPQDNSQQSSGNQSGKGCNIF